MSAIHTYGGRLLDLRTMCTADVDPVTIARALSHLCRFTGHTSKFYSVAEHSVRCSTMVPEEYQLEALLHDAHEAYVGDVAAPIKELVPDYCALEARVERVVRQRFGLPETMSPWVQRVDKHMLGVEASLVPGFVVTWAWPDPAMQLQSELGWAPDLAFEFFTARLNNLLSRRERAEVQS